MSNKNIILRTEQLAIGYPKKNGHISIASDIDISLKKGELIGLVGGNGIGKSTLLRTLSQMQNQINGSIYISDINIQNYSILDLSKTISIVLTEQAVSKNLTVEELVALGRQPYTNWVGKITQADHAIIDNAMRQTDILTFKHRKCFELSDGQFQKVMIARALAQDTDLIILDEPTTHLDMYHKAYILKLLQKLAKDTQKQYCFHRMKLILPFNCVTP